MALTPQQVRDAAKPSDEEIKRIEAKIDLALVVAAKRGINTVYLSLIEYFPDTVLYDAVKKIYHSAGWIVSRTTDQRDGDFVTIRQKTEAD